MCKYGPFHTLHYTYITDIVWGALLKHFIVCTTDNCLLNKLLSPYLPWYVHAIKYTQAKQTKTFKRSALVFQSNIHLALCTVHTTQAYVLNWASFGLMDDFDVPAKLTLKQFQHVSRNNNMRIP